MKAKEKREKKEKKEIYFYFSREYYIISLIK